MTVDDDLTPEERRIRDVLASVPPPASLHRYDRSPQVAPRQGSHGARRFVGWRSGALTLGVTVVVVAALVGGYFGLRGAGRSTVATATQPPARAYAAMGYDPDTQDVVMFGGAAADGAPLGDTWLWSGSSWRQALPSQSPPAAIGAEMAWDPRSQRVLLAGGVGGSGCRVGVRVATASTAVPSPTSVPGCSVRDDAWAWDGGDWAQVPLPAGLGSLSEASMATDPSSGRIMLIASGSTWSFDGSVFQPVASAAGTGGPTQYGGEVWFPDPGLLFDFGLTSLTAPPTQYVPDVSPCADPASCPSKVTVATAWQWSGAAWTAVDGTVQPMYATPFGAMSSSVAPVAVDLSDGEAVTVDSQGDTRVSDNPVEGWQLAASAAAIRAPTGAAIAYDPATGTVVLFGGWSGYSSWSGTSTPTTWIWNGRDWSGVSTGAAPPTGR